MEKFDYEKYIQERLREIEDIGERKFAKTLLFDGLGAIFASLDDKYSQLEQRIAGEAGIESSRYEIATTVVRKEYFDPLNESLFPVSLSDVEKDGESRRMTVYLEADDRQCQAFLHSQYVTAKANGSEIRLRISKSERYADTVNSLYQLFVSNGIPWNTIHMGHLERFFDLTDDSGGITGDPGLAVEWGQWEPYVRCGMVPLWNVMTQYYEVSNFMVPCMDQVHYEYTIKTEKPEERGYLFETGKNIHHIIFEKDRVVIQADTDGIEAVKAFIIHNNKTDGSYRYNSPVLTNRAGGSFCGRFLHKTGVFLQTRADLSRKVEELSGGYGIAVDGYEFRDEIPEAALYGDMNTFIKEEAFPYERRRVFLIYFKEPREKDCYCHSQIRYILSRLQQEYLEYKCVGVLR